MHETAVKRLPIPRNWLKINAMIRVVKGPEGEEVLEVKPVPNSVRRRSKRRENGNSQSKGVESGA